MEPGKWYCSYTLKCSIATMGVLQRKNMVIPHKRNGGLGSIWSPRTTNQWIKNDR